MREMGRKVTAIRVSGQHGTAWCGVSNTEHRYMYGDEHGIAHSTLQLHRLYLELEGKTRQDKKKQNKFIKQHTHHSHFAHMKPGVKTDEEEEVEVVSGPGPP